MQGQALDYMFVWLAPLVSKANYGGVNVGVCNVVVGKAYALDEAVLWQVFFGQVVMVT